MRIGINAVPLRAEGGGGRYLFEALFRQLLHMGPKHDYVIFAHPGGLPLVQEIINRESRRVLIVPILNEERIFQHRGKFEFFFCPMNNLRPRVLDRPTVAMLLDIQEQYCPQYFTPHELIARHEVYPELCRAATIVVTISQFSKQCLIEKFGIDPRKIEVIHLAPQDRLISRDRQDAGTWTRDPISRPFFFYPSNCYPHKNHALLLEAISKMPPPQSGGHSVIFAGFELPGGFPLRREIIDRQLADRCLFFSGLSPDEMRYLFRSAAAVVLPTMFEGFGIPAVEAMACGSPLICSDIPALREIAGDNALYFEPGNAQALCSQMRKIVSDEPLRSRMIDAGYSLAQKYTWEAAAQKMLEIFELAHLRFKNGNSTGSVPAQQPRIGIFIRSKRSGKHLEKTLQSIGQTKYPNLVVCLAGKSSGEASPESQGIRVEHVGQIDSDDARALLDFARRQKLDLVGEVLEGNRLCPSALDSLALSYTENSSATVHLGEAVGWIRRNPIDVSRMRLLDEQTWKLEGLLYPEMVFLAPAALARWADGDRIVQPAQPYWRWHLIQAAGPQNQLALLRRTLADCDMRSMGPLARLKAFRAGMSELYRRSDGQQIKVRLLRRFESPARKLSLILPVRLQYWGTRLWYRLSRGSASSES